MTDQEIPTDVFPARVVAAFNRITPDEARWLLGYYELPGGEKPPGFRDALITAIAKADPGNRRRLALSFPGMVAAFQAQEDVDGLRAIARSDGTAGEQ